MCNTDDEIHLGVLMQAHSVSSYLPSGPSPVPFLAVLVQIRGPFTVRFKLSLTEHSSKDGPCILRVPKRHTCEPKLAWSNTRHDCFAGQ